MKTKPQIEQRIKTLQVRKVAINTELKTGLWSSLGSIVEKSSINEEIRILQWVLSNSNELETIEISDNNLIQIQP
jgi:hypothetical protein